jgi:hypothetical protein
MSTTTATQRTLRRLRAPRDDRGVVVDPPWNDVPQTLADNLAAREARQYDFQGKSFGELIADARAELRAAAINWWKPYGGGRDPFDLSRPILLAGHQPQMFHPGVWLKNFALSELAERHGATAVNLIIDSDIAAHAAVVVPGGSLETPSRESVPYDLYEPIVPFEERRIGDRRLFESFAARAIERIRPLIDRPLLGKYWPLAVARGRSHGLLGAALAQSRHLLENSWGCSTWEVPQSVVCDQPAFFRFSAHLFAEMPRFQPIYNAAVDEYRRMHRIRNYAHPVPDLVAEDDWLETPFWIWSTDAPRRRRLFVRPSGRETVLSDRRRIEVRLATSPDSDADRGVEQLADLRRSGVKIRSRALITTLWARLVLGDLFIHGIGGGNYDHVTDTILERFFRMPPPHLMVLSATVLLPVARPVNAAEEPAAFDAKLRELTYHPEHFLDGPPSNGDPTASALVAEKSNWIAISQTRENAKQRCRAIRGVNERLQRYLTDRRRQLESARDAAIAEARRRRILSSREYAFCLYPEETIRDFYDGLLHEIS